jgi:hypothetical protein
MRTHVDGRDRRRDFRSVFLLPARSTRKMDTDCCSPTKRRRSQMPDLPKALLPPSLRSGIQEDRCRSIGAKSDRHVQSDSAKSAAGLPSASGSQGAKGSQAAQDIGIVRLRLPETSCKNGRSTGYRARGTQVGRCHYLCPQPIQNVRSQWRFQVLWYRTQTPFGSIQDHSAGISSAGRVGRRLRNSVQGRDGDWEVPARRCPTPCPTSARHTSPFRKAAVLHSSNMLVDSNQASSGPIGGAGPGIHDKSR